MKYFSNDLTSEQIKAEYRKLCKLFHPDLHGGDQSANWVAIMQAINAEYAVASQNARRAEEPKRRADKGWSAPTDSDYADMAAVDEKIRQAIEKIITFAALEIEICGQWVWISGTQKRGTSVENDAALDALMAADYKWSGNKKMWYFAGVPAGFHRKAWTIDQIRTAHGSSKVKRDRRDEDERKPSPAYMSA